MTWAGVIHKSRRQHQMLPIIQSDTYHSTSSWHALPLHCIISQSYSSSIYCAVDTSTKCNHLIYLSSIYVLHWLSGPSPGAVALLHRVTRWCHRVCQHGPAIHAVPGELWHRSRGRWAGWDRGRAPAAALGKRSLIGGGPDWGESRPCWSKPAERWRNNKTYYQHILNMFNQTSCFSLISHLKKQD